MIDRYNLSEVQLDINKEIMKRFIKKLGSQSDVAKYFEVSRQCVHRWKKTGKIPLYAAKIISLHFNMDVKKIRPDIFG